MLGSRGLDIFQADRLSGVLLTDRTAQEMVLMKHAHFTQVARIVANRHRLPDIGGERGIEIPNSLEVDAVAAHDARPGDLHQQQIEILQALGHAGEPPIGEPRRVRRHLDFAMYPGVVVFNEVSAQGVLELRQRPPRRRRRLAVHQMTR